MRRNEVGTTVVVYAVSYVLASNELNQQCYKILLTSHRQFDTSNTRTKMEVCTAFSATFHTLWYIGDINTPLRMWSTERPPYQFVVKKVSSVMNQSLLSQFLIKAWYTLSCSEISRLITWRLVTVFTRVSWIQSTSLYSANLMLTIILARMPSERPTWQLWIRDWGRHEALPILHRHMDRVTGFHVNLC